jgi:HlyD family secretion protein
VRKTWIYVLVVLVALTIAGLYVKNRIAQTMASQTASSYATAIVKRGTLDITVSGTANILPSEKVTVKSNVTGTVSKIIVDAGSPVRDGQPVLVINNESLVQQLAQAKVDLESQQHRLEVLRSPSSVDRGAAEARVQQAEVALANRKKDVDKLTLSSPINGRVLSVKVNPGDAVIPSQPVIIVVDDTEIYVVAQVLQSEVSKIKPGQIAALAFGSELPSTTGVVDSVGIEASGAVFRGPLVPVHIKTSNPGGIYRSGLSANATIKLSSEEAVSAGGTVAPKTRYDLRAEVSGTIDEVVVRENDAVAAGQTLVRVKNDTVQVLVKQADSDLQTARDQLAKIRSGLAPNIAESDVVQQEFRVRQAGIALQARAVEVGYLEPKSPMDGILTNRHVTRGDTVGPGTPLFTVADYSKMTMIVPVDELDVAQIKPGQKAAIRVEALPGRSFEGAVTKIATEGTVKDGVASYDVTITLTDTKDLRGGMTGTARIQVGRREDVLLAPAEAIRREAEKTRVAVLRKGAIVTIDVQVGLSSNTMAEILSGLAEGDVVVVSSLEAPGNPFGIPTPPKGSK